MISPLIFLLLGSRCKCCRTGIIEQIEFPEKEVIIVLREMQRAVGQSFENLRPRSNKLVKLRNGSPIDAQDEMGKRLLRQWEMKRH